MAKKKRGYIIPEPTKVDDGLFEQFIVYYGGLKFKEVMFRPGAGFTSSFGLTDRYKVINGRVVWGYPGIHRGVDRSGAIRKKVGKRWANDPIFTPFNFGSSGFYDFGGHGFGSEVCLYNSFGFRVRICHMFPGKIAVKDSLMRGYAFNLKTLIGSAGSYGFSTGNHTHTEIESWGFNGEWLKTCGMLDIILDEKFGRNKTRSDFTDEEIIEIYRRSLFTKSWEPKRCLKDYKKILKSQGIIFLNEFKAVYMDRWDRKTTLYNSAKLFNM